VPEDQLVVGSYNLKNGGIDEGRDARLHRQLAMLAAAGADAWMLQECKWWSADGHAALHLAERMLGMRGFLVPSGHHGCDVAVMVREPGGIRVTRQCHEAGAPYWHAVARVAAEYRGVPLYLASAHFAPASPLVRLMEAEAFALVTKARGGWLVAGGDWNLIPASDPGPPAGASDADRLRRRVDGLAAQALAEPGLTDVAAFLQDSTPTVGHKPGGGLAYRCDGLYTTLPPECITGYRVIAEGSPESDHRPVLAAFTLPGGGQAPGGHQ
jgi:endonuclease/exonuclease/phosphatase family metal-dependent hydrolase